jgi:pimeloyl-ACP methyl ester carboxylesterase
VTNIHFEQTGSGFPLLLIAGGGLNSTISYFTRTAPFNPIEEFKGEYRCIAADLRNANGGQSSGPLEIDRPWDSHTDDQLGVMDHLGINQFMVMGFCIGGLGTLKQSARTSAWRGAERSHRCVQMAYIVLGESASAFWRFPKRASGLG